MSFRKRERENRGETLLALRNFCLFVFFDDALPLAVAPHKEKNDSPSFSSHAKPTRSKGGGGMNKMSAASARHLDLNPRSVSLDGRSRHVPMRIACGASSEGFPEGLRRRREMPTTSSTLTSSSSARRRRRQQQHRDCLSSSRTRSLPDEISRGVPWPRRLLGGPRGGDGDEADVRFLSLFARGGKKEKERESIGRALLAHHFFSLKKKNQKIKKSKKKLNNRDR